MRLDRKYLALIGLCAGGAIVVFLALASSPNLEGVRSRANEPTVSHGPVSNTTNLMRGLIRSLQFFEYETGRPASSLRDAYCKAPQNYQADRVRDAWGQDLRMTVSDDSIGLQSAGADGLFGSTDDLSVTDSRELPDELKRSAAEQGSGERRLIPACS